MSSYLQIINKNRKQKFEKQLTPTLPEKEKVLPAKEKFPIKRNFKIKFTIKIEKIK